VNTIDGPTKLVRQDAILGGLSISQLQTVHRLQAVLRATVKLFNFMDMKFHNLMLMDMFVDT